MTAEDFLAELAQAGFPFTDLTDLSNSKQRYDAAIPILLRWLPTTTGATKLGIVRALGKPWARSAVLDPLIAEFRAGGIPGDENLRWTIGDSLYIVWSDHRFDELAELAADRRYGYSRAQLVRGLGKSRRPEAIGILLAQLDDSDEAVLTQALDALSRRGDEHAIPALVELAADPRNWVRNDAQRAMTKIERRLAAVSKQGAPTPPVTSAPRPSKRWWQRGTRRS